MGTGLGFVATAGLLYADSILIRPKRSIGDIVAQVTIQEVHRDEVQITEHPVEQGAAIADHAYELPAELVVTCAWSNSPTVNNALAAVANAPSASVAGVQSLITGNTPQGVRDVYASLLKLKSLREPFTVYTGKRRYSNMLIKSLATTTDAAHENSLEVTFTLKQVIIVSTTTSAVSAPPARQANPSATAPTTDSGTKSLAPTNRFNDAGGGRGFVNPPLVIQ